MTRSDMTPGQYGHNGSKHDTANKYDSLWTLVAITIALLIAGTCAIIFGIGLWTIIRWFK